MWAIIGVLLAAAVIGLIEIPSLVRRKLKKELVCFSLLLLLATGFSIAKSMQLQIPNPLDWITVVYQPMSDAITSWLG
ncbi:hypothetical protein ACFQI7_16390 [Paenibacillus allorhizosphaerae]|uniref:Uncharacterized protein n=1 Tax=Paenibacillus allorhizosphaerae TaxID=2849866 RepID=A0ABM8VRY8_9BACL|nr:hypothetical protein [Paenibacillus allorhizosphaerae]CAG7655936.1 hypothetical protein PAECIP111802_06256 [Paenibacillus allorhizosphaerae]